ncbi:hypothetical protein R6Q59_010224 [Mikania micrantha]
MQRQSHSGVVSTGVPSPTDAVFRPDRPCDSCRRRKTRCVLGSENADTCVLCAFHNQSCTFVEDATPRKRKGRTLSGDDGSISHQRTILAENQALRHHSETSIRTTHTNDDYANLQGTSLLKKTLGLQNHQYTKYLGPTAIHDGLVLGLRLYDNVRNESSDEHGSFRQVARHHFFHQQQDTKHPDHAQDFKNVDEIEKLVAPHGPALVKLYFRIVHPTFPILHKKVYLEKYSRSSREFSPPLLAAVYRLALNWWTYSTEVEKFPKPNVAELEGIAVQALWRLSRRAKLSTVQAGLLLSQIPSVSSWPLTTLIVGIAQDLGLHLDCTDWRIPLWERGLRKRIAGAVFMQDTWSASVFGRPAHIALANWGPQPVTSSDFPENAADEDDEEGSTEVEKGRTLFCAMITLTKMLYDVLESMYSMRAEMEVANADESTERILAQAKPIQIRLRSWYAQMPDSLQIDKPTTVGKLDSVGYLHLAYYATEMTIHRKIIKHISNRTDPYLTQVCRTAAKSRLVSAMDFFDRLKPEHFQSFWYFASTFNFTLIGTFAGLCLVTSASTEEVGYYQERLQRYRWSLRVQSNGIDFLKQVSDTLASALEPLTVPTLNATTTKTQKAPFPVAVTVEDEEDNGNFNSRFGHTVSRHLFDHLDQTDLYLDDGAIQSV